MDNNIYFIDEESSTVRFSSNPDSNHGEVITDHSGAGKFAEHAKNKSVDLYLETVNQISEEKRLYRTALNSLIQKEIKKGLDK